MMLSALRWLGRNISTLLLAFLLAVVVWVTAVTSSDPNEQGDFVRAVTIEIVGQDSGLLLMGNVASQVRLRLDAPHSVWTQLNSEADPIRAWIDLSTLGAGTHIVPVQVQVKPYPVRVIRVDPIEVRVTLEPLVTRVFPVTITETGRPATGYKAEALTFSPTEITVSGPESIVAQVKELHGTLDISNASEPINVSLILTALDEAGDPVNGVTITPKAVSVTQPINLLGGYRNVIVKVVTTGQVASGYKLTNIFVTPANVIVFSSDPTLVNELPGYVETKEVDLTGAADDLEARVDLALPAGVSVVGDPKVLVQVSIAAIESSLSLSIPVDFTGLTPGFKADVAPLTVDVIVSGPVPVLDALKPSDIRAKVDLTGLVEGVYRLEPVIELLPERVAIVSILPPTVDVTIVMLPTPTPTHTPSPTSTPTITPSPTPTPRR